jgi:nicotinate-nucleotide adenylyltransferase
MRIAILGGSFNPIHIGHLALANYLCEYDYADELWFLVSPQNPLKVGDTLWDDELRLRLVRRAIEGYPRFRVCDVEFALPRPSYTIDTLAHLRRAYPQHTFTLVIGSDNWQKFPAWRSHETLIAEYPILVYPRRGYDVDASLLPPTVVLVDAPLIDVSSTFVRRALGEGKDIRYFLHPSTKLILS